MIHALLFQERVKRIIPSVSQMDSEHYEVASQPNAICRQYLGYEFIEDSEFWEARDEVEYIFCRFLEDAHAAGNGSHFESLLGKGYSDRLKFGNSIVIGGTQHFVYAEKFAPKVIEMLKRFDWMRFNRPMKACEMKSELCNLYMAVLACSISKRSGLPVSTDVRFAEEMTKSPLFAEYFPEVIPERKDGEPLHDFCVTLLVRNPDSALTGQLPLEAIITFPEAVRIRAGLEEQRRGFRSVVDRLVAKATAVNPMCLEGYLKSEVSNVLDAAQEYKASIDAVAASEVAADRRDLIGNIETGFSTLSPITGAAFDLLTGAAGLPGIGTAIGGAIALAAYAIPRLLKHQEDPSEPQLTERQEAYLFMNRMWALSADRQQTAKSENQI